jgi:hypothetical protein
VTQVRPVRWHDLPLIYRLIGHGVSFDSQFSVTIGEDGLRHHPLSFWGDIHAVVLKEPKVGLGVLSYPAGAVCAGLAYLAPELDGDASTSLWFDLLDGLTYFAGRQGVVALKAEVNEGDADVFQTFRQSDFAVYARQSLWQGPAEQSKISGNGLIRRASPAEVQAVTDAWNARLPGLLRQAKFLPGPSAECYVLMESRAPRGMAAVYRGAQQTLVDIFLSLESSDDAEQFVRSVLAHVGQASGRVVVRLRHDMEWLGNPLERLGFYMASSQVVMIRHTLAQAKHYSFKKVPAVPGTLPTTNIGRIPGLEDYFRQPLKEPWRAEEV